MFSRDQDVSQGLISLPLGHLALTPSPARPQLTSSYSTKQTLVDRRKENISLDQIYLFNKCHNTVKHFRPSAKCLGVQIDLSRTVHLIVDP